MKNVRLIILAGLALLGVCFLSIWLLLRPTTKVKIAYLPIYVDLPLFVALENGFFDRHGVSVEPVAFNSSPDIGVALVNGDVAVGASVAYSVVLSSESRDPNKLKVFIIDSETPENYLSSFVVLKNSGITKMEDLRGKRIASFPGPTALTFGKMVLEKYGLKPNIDCAVFDMDSSTHLDALTSGKVDALFTYEPTATQAVLERGAVKLLPGAVEKEIINPWQAGVWVVGTKYATEHPAEARKIIQALYDAVDFIRSNPLEAKIALSKYTKIKQKIARETPDIPFAKIWEADMIAFQKHADILQKRGIISKHIDASGLLATGEWLPPVP